MKIPLLTSLLLPTLVACTNGPIAKAILDEEVNRLCSIDGGINVYETVKLPADKFNQWGQINFYRPTQGENELGPEYLFKEETTFYRQGNPSMVRYRHQIFSRTDGKLLGETTSYGRGGGDIPGPWEPSNYHCPPTSVSSEIALSREFI